ncbi:MAG TPA: A/G-specific adenine glycosylase [Candidatus Sulfotelmatobacter sp.]|nr:A/G-specific adenine glycosylase [Candidatus Sulfotelmatobacter sp.]
MRSSPATWARPLPCWYARRGRHHLPWRQTRDPWPILVSELMLQQTPVSRVLPRYAAFLQRWPEAHSCAASPLREVLREWQGLGYPRRAKALHDCAGHVAARGWPMKEVGLRRLPGVGPYTARALLAFAFERATVAPREVNLSRVAARAALGVEPHEARPADLDAEISRARPRGMSWRHYTYALFDVGALHCRSRSPRCEECPLDDCLSRRRLREVPPVPSPRRQAPYHGSLRQLRGALLALSLSSRPPSSISELRSHLATVPAAHRRGAIEKALADLAREGLLPEARVPGH